MANSPLLPPWLGVPVSRSSEENDPFQRREMNRPFGDPGILGSPNPFPEEITATPIVDVSGNDNEIYIIAELPGVDENDIWILLLGNTLIIRGEKKGGGSR